MNGSWREVKKGAQSVFSVCEAPFSWEVWSWIKKLTPDGSAGKESACNAGDEEDMGSVPKSGRSPGIGNSYSLQYSCLENSRDRGAWWVTVHGDAKSQTLWSMHTHVCTHTYTHTHTHKEAHLHSNVSCLQLFQGLPHLFCIDPLSQDPGLQGTSPGFYEAASSWVPETHFLRVFGS